MTWGTSHFVSKARAIKYYAMTEENPKEAVKQKLKEGLIHIGRPVLCLGQRLLIIDGGLRYAIHEEEHK